MASPDFIQFPVILGQYLVSKFMSYCFPKIDFKEQLLIVLDDLHIMTAGHMELDLPVPIMPVRP